MAGRGVLRPALRRLRRSRRGDRGRRAYGSGPRRRLKLEFFVDRSLGRLVVPEALRAVGLTVHTLASVYGEGRGQRVADTEWLALAGERGWVVLMKDDRIRRRPRELGALVAAGLRTFCITNASLTGAQYAERLVRHRHRIVQRCRRQGPFIEGVYETGLRRLWP